MFRSAVLSIALILSPLVAAWAADVNGLWKGKIEANGESVALVYDLKADGNKLTGTAEGPAGKLGLENGKLDGDKISFNQKMSFNGNDMVIKYTGKVEGDSIKFTRIMTTPDGHERKTEFTAKK